MTEIIDPLKDAFVVKPSVTVAEEYIMTSGTLCYKNSAKTVDIRDVKIAELEENVRKLTWRVSELEERVFGKTEKYEGE